MDDDCKEMQDSGSGDVDSKINQLTKEHNICVNALKTLANEITSSKDPLPEELRRHGLVACAELRRINREMQLIAQAKREETFAKRQKLENRFLILHNLLYEKARVQEEIDRCLGIESLDENIKLIDLDEFYSSAPPEISQPEQTKQNEHLQRIARLKWELKQRQHLNSLASELKSESKQLLDQVQEDAAKAEGIWPKLTAIENACIPMKEYMLAVVGPEETSYGEMLEVSKLISQTLYNIYSMAICYTEETGNSLSCLVHRIDDEVSELMDETVVHPYCLIVTLQKDRLEIPIQFCHLPEKKVVCAKLLKGKNEEEYLGPFHASLLDVFEINGTSEMVDLPNELEYLVGRPYRFAQYLAGSLNDPKSKTTFHTILGNIRARLDCRCKLNKIINELAGSHPTDVVCKSSWPKMNVFCKIDSWGSVDPKELEQDGHILPAEREDMKRCVVFKCRLRRDKVCLNSYIAIPADFPERPPRPISQIVKKDGSVLTRNCSSDLKHLEYAVRTQTIEATGKCAEPLLGFLKCLMICFDVLVSNRQDFGSGNQRQASACQNIAMVVKGRWRDLPFFIDEETGTMEH